MWFIYGGIGLSMITATASLASLVVPVEQWTRREGMLIVLFTLACVMTGGFGLAAFLLTYGR